MIALPTGRDVIPGILIFALVGALACVVYHSVAIYSDVPAYGDAQYGFPLVYGYDQDDVVGEFLFRLAGFKFSSFIADVAFGSIAGATISFVWIRLGDWQIRFRWVLAGGLLLCFTFLQSLRTPIPKRIQSVHREAEAIAVSLNQYKEIFGSYPEKKIWDALTGKNAKGTMFLDIPGGADPWKTPYEISMSDNHIWIRSAGPDRKFTDGSLTASDDIVYSFSTESDR